MAVLEESDEWVEAELERQLREISLDGQDGDEDDDIACQPRLEDGSTAASVAELFRGYRQTLHSQHLTLDSLLTEAQSSLHTPTGGNPHTITEAPPTLHTPTVDIPHTITEAPPTFHIPTVDIPHTITEAPPTPHTIKRSTPHHVTGTGVEVMVLPVAVMDAIPAQPQPSKKAPDQRCPPQPPSFFPSSPLSNAPPSSTSPDLQSEAVRMTLAGLRAEQVAREDELRREQEDRQAAIEDMIRESERLKREQQVNLANRAASLQRRQLQASIIVQSHWRGYRARQTHRPQIEAVRRERERRREEEEERVREVWRRAVTTIQTSWRGYRARHWFRAQLAERRQNAKRCATAATTIQAYWKGYQCRKSLVLEESRQGQREQELLAMKPASEDHTQEETGRQEGRGYGNTASSGLWEENPLPRLEAQPQVSIMEATPKTTEAVKNTLGPRARGNNFETRANEQISSAYSLPPPPSSGVAEQHNHPPYLDTDREDGRKDDRQRDKEMVKREEGVREPDSTVTGEQVKGEGGPPQERQKFTIARRLQSALKLLESQQLAGGESHNIAARSSSFTDGMGTTSQSGNSAVGLGGMGTRTRIPGTGLSQASRRALHDELQRVQHEEEERRIAQQQKTFATGTERKPGSGSVSLPSSPRKFLRRVRLMSDGASPTQGGEMASHCGLTHNSEETENQSVSMRETSVSLKEGRRVNFARERQTVDGAHRTSRKGTSPTNERNGRSPQRHLEKLPHSSPLAQHPSAHPSRDLEGPLCSEGGGEVVEAIQREQRAMESLAVNREREEVVAQMSRERMSMILTTEEVSQAARVKRSQSTYKKELEYACHPLPPQAWLGVVMERQAEWRSTHIPWSELDSRANQSAKVDGLPRKRHPSGHPKALSDAQLLATSPQGTQLDEVTQVILYRSRQPVELSSLQRCPRLCSLSLTKCGVMSLAGLELCPQLTGLTLHSNEMQRVEWEGSESLRFLDLSENRLTSAHGLGECPALLQLSLAENRIARVAGLSGCRRLQKLNLSGNLLVSSKGLDSLPFLQSLSLSENHLPQLGNLSPSPLLHHLNISQNNIQELPFFTNHVLLRELNLTENHLSSLTPITQAWLPLLETLSLANNCFTELAPLTTFIVLQTLDLSNNLMYDLPSLLQSLRGCYRLRTLSISGNPVAEEPKVKSYLTRILVSLETLDDQELTARKRGKMPEEVESNELYQLCRRQLCEQDEMCQRHQEQLEASTDDLRPQRVAEMMEHKVSHCLEYEQLLVKHLKEHESFGMEQRRPRPPSQDRAIQVNDVRGKAAVVLQAAVRGWGVRREVWRWQSAAVKIQRSWRRYHGRRSKAATVVQAVWKGYHLRKRLMAALERAQCSEEDTGEENLDEELNLDFLDESLLDADLKPFSPTDEHYNLFYSSQSPPSPTHPIHHPAPPPPPKPITIPSYHLPGAADTEITLEAWRKEQPQPRHQIPASSSIANGSRRESLHGGDGDNLEEESGNMVYGGRMEGSMNAQQETRQAWGSATEAPVGESQGFVKPIRDGGGGEVNSGGRDNEDRHLGQTVSRKQEQLASEWGFKSSATAELMIKRAQRQKKMETSAIRRKKLADPTTRLARFKKREVGGTTVWVPDDRQRPRQRPKIPYFQASSSTKSTPTPDPEETRSKEDYLYQWVHQQQVVYSDTWSPQGRVRVEGGSPQGRVRVEGGRASEVPELRLSHGQTRKPQPAAPWYRSGSGDRKGILPSMEPHILAGHTPRLVSSDVQNQLTPTPVTGQGPSQHRQELKATSLHAADPHRSAPKGNWMTSQSFPSMPKHRHDFPRDSR